MPPVGPNTPLLRMLSAASSTCGCASLVRVSQEHNESLAKVAAVAAAAQIALLAPFAGMEPPQDLRHTLCQNELI